jgi:predicted carbohydrate-binding protein with CBM5 and CBM33 domain
MNNFLLLVVLIVISAAAFVLFMTALSAHGQPQQPGAPEEIAALTPQSQSQNESSDVIVNNTNATTPMQPTPEKPQPNPPWAWLPISYSPPSKSIAVLEMNRC